LARYCPECGFKNNDNAKFCDDCGADLWNRGTQKITLLDNRYEILSVIKSGNMGRVYKAIDTRLDVAVAVKMMFPVVGNAEDERYAKKRFLEEARILSKLHHGGLPNVSDFFIENDPNSGKPAHYLVMTFIEGKDLETLMNKRMKNPLPVNESLDYFRQILNILSYLHSHKPPVIYRDMKPSNIMIQDGTVFLVDFGIARLFIPQTKGTLIGTPGYASPEQFKGYTDPRSDLYSLGAVIHYILTGIDPQDPSLPPFQFKPIKDLNSLVPDYLNGIIISMLDLVLAKRPESADRIMEILDAGERSTATVSRKFIPMPPVRPKKAPPTISQPRLRIIRQSSSPPDAGKTSSTTSRQKDKGIDFGQVKINGVDKKDKKGETPSYKNMEKIISLFYDKVFESLRSNLARDLSCRIRNVNRGLRRGRNYMQCYKIEGYTNLNFCLKPTNNYSEIDLFIHDNTGRKFSKLFKKIRQSDSFKNIKNKWGRTTRSSKNYLLKERTSFTSWNDLNFARKAGEHIALLISIVLKLKEPKESINERKIISEDIGKRPKYSGVLKIDQSLLNRRKKTDKGQKSKNIIKTRPDTTIKVHEDILGLTDKKQNAKQTSGMSIKTSETSKYTSKNSITPPHTKPAIAYSKKGNWKTIGYGLLAFFILAIISFISFFIFACSRYDYLYNEYVSDSSRNNEIYILKVYEKNPKKIENLTKIIKEEGFEFTSEKVKKTLSKPIGYSVRQAFDKSQNPDKFLQFLNSKKIICEIKEDPDTERVFLEVKKVFKKEEEARAMQDKIRNLLTIQFEIVPIMKEFPYTTNEIKIENIPDQDKLEALKSKLSEHIKNPDRDIEVETITLPLLEPVDTK